MSTKATTPPKPKRDRFDVALRLLTLAIALFGVWFASYQYNQGIKNTNNSSRPIVTIRSSKYSYDSLLQMYQAVFSFQNYGTRPAYNFERVVSIIGMDSAGTFDNVVHTENETFANSMVPSVEFVYPTAGYSYANKNYIFYKVTMKYNDNISNKEYGDSLYFVSMCHFFRDDKMYNPDNLKPRGINYTQSVSLDSVLKGKQIVSDNMTIIK
ncbi:hypothetical protein [Ferruginibacter sp. SUN106]|uniref:hypothetical protein n=1 Tax=Ferruginibacter sp. SUN106 TaxID=2978348 RepID=UPI003D36776D